MKDHYHLYFMSEMFPLVETIVDSREKAKLTTANYLSHFYSRPNEEDKLMLTMLETLNTVKEELDHVVPNTISGTAFSVHIHQCDEDCYQPATMN